MGETFVLVANIDIPNTIQDNFTQNSLKKNIHRRPTSMHTVHRRFAFNRAVSQCFSLPCVTHSVKKFFLLPSSWRPPKVPTIGLPVNNSREFKMLRRLTVKTKSFKQTVVNTTCHLLIIMLAIQ